MAPQKIRVGLIGLGGWAKYGHIPALQALPEEFEIVAVASRRQALADEYAAQFSIPHAFSDEQALITHPDVDLVVILAPAPEHARLAQAAIAAGKDVYSEWPLTTSTAESAELLALAEAKGVHHVVGLQRRLGPSARYLRDLVRQGYVGKVRSARMTVSADAFVPTMSEKHAWAFPAANFSHVLSIYGGHFMDVLFQAVGFPRKLAAVVENQFPFFTVVETGAQIPNTTPNEAMVMGTLAGGGLFAVQIEGAQQHRTGLQIDITGTEGVLRMTNVLAFGNKEDNAIEGMRGDETTFSPLPVPAAYHALPVAHLDASVQDVAYLYAAYAHDRQNGTSEASSFHDALKQHHLLDQIARTSETFFS
ncbi:MAG: Gfo/Idh/MocA family protein [Janthinobacterium lividum]